MSGHSKWSTIKHQKSLADQKRGQIFTKLSNAITIAVKEGGGITDPQTNFRLRLAIEKAKEANMPKENIERAIERGKKSISGNSLSEMIYEGYAPFGVSLVIKALTDNHQRTLTEIKSILDKAGGKICSPGSVIYQFKPFYLVLLKDIILNYEDLFNLALEANADDFIYEKDKSFLKVKKENLNLVKDYLSAKKIEIGLLEEIYEPQNTITIDNPLEMEKITTLFKKLENLEEIQKVFSNLKN